ncbi:MAG: hypothetical protein ACE5GA_10810, partial [Candidatus Zixiibacteriota bacterium]
MKANSIMCLRLQITCAMVALIQLPVFLTPLGAQTLSFSGEINTVRGEPIVGATVRLLSDGVTLTAVACDAEGRFRLGWKAGPDQTAAAVPDALSLEVSCVGFTPTKVKLSGEAQSRALRIT